MQKMPILSGNCSPSRQEGTSGATPTPPQTIKDDTELLRDFLEQLDQTSADADGNSDVNTDANANADAGSELITTADRFVNIDTNSKADRDHCDLASDKGILSAEAILSNTVTSPTGTQVVSTLSIDARTVESFEFLRSFSVSKIHRRLSSFITPIQETFGSKDLWPNAPTFAGFHAIVDPMLLAGYVPYAEEIVDLRDDQIEECFHPFQEIDGYPTIQGTPLWERQEWERIEYYNLFKLYRDMRYAFYNESDTLLVNRSIAVLSRAVRVSARTISYLSTVYQWNLRVTLYDAWMATMQHRRESIKRSLMLDRHSKVSQKLVQKAFNCLNKQENKLTAKDALEMLKLGLAYERISMGMPGDKPETQPTSSQAPLLSFVQQTNNTAGMIQVNQSNSSQQLQENLKKPDTLLGILSVLQRSGAFDTLIQSVEAKEANSVENAPTNVAAIEDAEYEDYIEEYEEDIVKEAGQ